MTLKSGYYLTKNATVNLTMAVVCALGNNKRRLSADGTATPFRHPLATLAGADQAHTLLLNRPKNPPLLRQMKIC